ncbi:unnamed protein product [Ceutorhynchus assimilis]|uniref:Cytochrome P450 n=1 Tax=Ceutorhynchus assimilis TaxID=467358 RepID=A0A9N9MVH2_9CUCU|nr:unnamed protein product [Ceutorhynchus assimilis]
MMDIPIWYIVIFVFLFVYIALYLYMLKIKDRTKYMVNVPGPTPIFPFGNTLDYIYGSTGVLRGLMDSLKQYGETIVVNPGSFDWAIITIDYDFNELLFSSAVHIQKPTQYDFLHGWLGQGLLTSYGAHWKNHRRVITPAFHFSILQDYISIFNAVGDKFIEKLKNEVGKDSMEISKIVSLCTLDVICEAAMGVKINALEEENSKYIKSVKTLCSIMPERAFSPLNPFFYPLTLNYFREKRALKVIHKLVEEVISKRIEDHRRMKNIGSTDLTDEFGVRKRKAFLDLLLESSIDGKLLSMQELRDEVNTFMFEGHDTVSSAITFSLLMISEHPEVQDKLIKEQLEIFGSNLTSVTPTYKELNEMKYLDLVIKETLRLFPSVPYFGRRLAQDTEFKGNLYPKGINVMIFPFAFHRNPKYFPEPEKFIPERFVDLSSKYPYAYTPFSAGPRNCIGQKFAMLEMLSTISKVVRNFKLAPARPQHQIQLAAETILISKNGVKISIENRTY